MAKFEGGYTPRYTFTKDLDEYVDSWKEIGSVLEKVFDLRLSGFNPGFLLVSDKSGPTLDITAGQAIKIYELYNQLQEERAIRVEITEQVNRYFN